MSSKTDILLKKLYYDVKKPSSFSNSYKLYKAAKRKNRNITLSMVQDFLAGEDVYTLHKPTRKPKKYRKTIAHGIDAIHQADLVDVSALSRENKGNKFILTNIDIFSRKAWAVPIKNKTGISVKNAFELIHKESVPQKVHTDLGSEFYNKTVQDYFKSKGITHYSSASDFKAAICERFNRTLKSKMWKYFSKTGKLNYTSILQDIVQSYNNSKHSSIGTSPNRVTKTNESRIWNHQYKDEIDKRQHRHKYKIGDFVRLLHLDNPFTKKYLPRFTKEVFIIADRLNTKPVTYRVMDQKQDISKGGFYDNELVRVKIKD